MKLRDIIANWTPAQWEALLLQYQLPASCLTGKPGPCPICGGTDRFTYDNKRGRGDWVCRSCNDGRPMAGDGIQLICRYTGMSFAQVARAIEAEPLPDPVNVRLKTPVSVASRVGPVPGQVVARSDCPGQAGCARKASAEEVEAPDVVGARTADGYGQEIEIDKVPGQQASEELEKGVDVCMAFVRNDMENCVAFFYFAVSADASQVERDAAAFRALKASGPEYSLKFDCVSLGRDQSIGAKLLLASPFVPLDLPRPITP